MVFTTATCTEERDGLLAVLGVEIAEGLGQVVGFLVGEVLDAPG